MNGAKPDPNLYALVGESEPYVQMGSDAKKDSLAMQTEGFVSLGYSSFNGKFESINNAKTQAKRIGATRVLVYSSYTDTDSGVLPITSFTPGQYVTTNNYGNFSANTYGNRGYANTTGTYSGRSSTYVPGSTNTEYVPYNVRRYDQAATYWVKRTKWDFGGRLNDVPDDMKKSMGTNQGALLVIVVKNTPAYRADLFPGDVIMTINRDVVYGPSEAAALMKKYMGQKPTFTILRDGKILERIVALGE